MLGMCVVVKVVAGGNVDESLFISGVVFGSDAKLPMRSFPAISYPKILLLACSLSASDRDRATGEGSEKKNTEMVSMEELCEQEEHFLRLKVSYMYIYTYIYKDS